MVSLASHQSEADLSETHDCSCVGTLHGCKSENYALSGVLRPNIIRVSVNNLLYLYVSPRRTVRKHIIPSEEPVAKIATSFLGLLT